MDYKVRLHVSSLYTSNIINPTLNTSHHPYIQKQEKLIHDFILSTRLFLLKRGKQGKKRNKENETYTLYFMFSYKYSTYQISWMHVMENNIKITYELIRRQET